MEELEKIYFNHNGSKYVDINGLIYKVLSKKEFVDKAVNDLAKRKNKVSYDMEEVEMTKNKEVKKLKLKSTEYSGNFYDYTVKEDDIANTAISISNEETGALFIVDNKYKLVTLIDELIEIKNSI